MDTNPITATLVGDTVTLTFPSALTVWFDPAADVEVAHSSTVVFEGVLQSDTVVFDIDPDVDSVTVTVKTTLLTSAPYSEEVVVLRPEPTPTETPTPTPDPTTVPDPTATPDPTPDPTATPDPTPDPTPAATQTPTPDPTATPQPRQAAVVGPLGANPVTGRFNGNTVVIEFPTDLAMAVDPAQDIVVRYNPTVYVGPLPANRLVAFAAPAGLDQLTVTVEAMLRSGVAYSETVDVERARATGPVSSAPTLGAPFVPGASNAVGSSPPLALPAIQPDTNAASSSSPGTAGSAAGSADVATAPELAFTGSASTFLTMMGLLSVMLGSLLAGFSRRRRSRFDGSTVQARSRRLVDRQPRRRTHSR